MPKWPPNCRTPESVYIFNEAYGTGRYPVSQNKHWHSGIHINFQSGSSTKVYPLQKGELAAYRISREYQKVQRPQVISGVQWERLPGSEQQLYQRNNSFWGGGGYKLKPNLQPEDMYEKYNNSFVMLRHFFTVRDRKSGAFEKIPFFTLYTNIIPGHLSDDAQNYGHLEAAPKNIPFYHKYRFRVHQSASNKYRDSDVDGKNIKLFPGSYCYFLGGAADNSDYICHFDNFSRYPSQGIAIPKEHIEHPSNPKYIPSRPCVPIYKSDEGIVRTITPTTEKASLREHQLGTLKSHAYFSSPLESVGKFYKVLVYKDEVNGDGANVDNKKVLVWQEDLKARGYLKETGCTTGTIQGIIVYNNIKGEEQNACDILEEGAEFELAEPKKLLNHPSGDTATHYRLVTDWIMDRDNPRYIKYEKKDGVNPLEVKVVWDTLETVVTPSGAPVVMGEETLLGYGYRPPHHRHVFYDAVLFFNNCSFMDTEYVAVNRSFFVPTISYNVGKKIGKDIVFSNASFDWPQAMKITAPEADNGSYTRFFYRGEYTYFDGTGVIPQTVNMLEWSRFFRILERQADEEVFDGFEFIQNNYNWGADGDNVGSVLQDTKADWYREHTSYDSWEAKSIKRSIICGHPLEWDQELYFVIGFLKESVRRSYGSLTSRVDEITFAGRVKAVDIWEGLKGKRIEGLDTSKNNFWFAHPIYFLRHLDDAGLLDRTFNPYADLPYVFEVDQRRGAAEPEERRSFIVRDNPGFAPTVAAPGYTEERLQQEARRYNGQCFGDCTSPYGIKRWQLTVTRHTGIDFGCGKEKKENRPVLALVHGIVWACSPREIPDFGNVMVIKNTNEDRLYMLAHLKRFEKKEGETFEPGETVAIAGNTTGGSVTSTGIHLHLEVFRCDIDERESVLNVSAIARNARFYEWWKDRNFGINNRVDPFNHDIHINLERSVAYREIIRR